MIALCMYVCARVCVLPSPRKGQLLDFRDTIFKIFIQQHYEGRDSAVMVNIKDKDW